MTAEGVGSIIKCRLNGRACAGTGTRLFSDIRWELAFSRVGSLLERRERMSGWSYGDVSERGSVWKHFLSICFEFGNTEGFDGLCKQTMDVLYQKLIVCNVLQCRTAESRRSVFAPRLFGSVLKKSEQKSTIRKKCRGGRPHPRNGKRTSIKRRNDPN